MKEDIAIRFMGQIEAEQMRDCKVNLQLTWESLYNLQASLTSMIQDSKDPYSIRRACRLLDSIDELHELSFNLHQAAKK